MKKHDAAPRKKTEIIQTAKKLFYENGIAGTSFNEIAEACGVTAPLITYHFKTKANLVASVFYEVSKEVKNAVAFKIYTTEEHYDLQVSAAVELLTLLHFGKEDKKASEMFSECITTAYRHLFDTNFYEIYLIHDRQYHLNVDKSADELSMLAIGAQFSCIALMYAYFNGYFKCNFNQFCDYVLTNQFQYMKIDESRIKEIIREAEALYERLNIKILPYFTVG